MILSEIRTHVRRLIGEPTSSGNPFWTNDEIDDAIHFGEQFIGSIIRRPQAKQSFTTVSGTREYTTLSAGTIHVETVDYDGYLLYPLHYEDTVEPTTRTQRPTNYYLLETGRQIVVGLYPTPNAAKTVTCLTAREPVTPATDATHSQIPDMWMWGVISFAAVILKMKDREFAEARAMSQEMLKELVQAVQKTKTQQHHRFETVRDADYEGPDLAGGRLWIS